MPEIEIKGAFATAQFIKIRQSVQVGHIHLQAGRLRY
jgi:hypothetical protein